MTALDLAEWVPVEPIARIQDELGRIENCPVCDGWLRPRMDRVIRLHKGSDRQHCTGTGGTDLRTFLVRFVPTGPLRAERWHYVTGRYAAETLRRAYRRKRPPIEGDIQIFQRRAGGDQS